MTDVPEHLLRRAAERRAAKSGEAGASPAPAAAAGEPAGAAPAGAVEPAAAAAAPAAAAPPPPVPPYVAAAERRPRVPKFAIPVLAALPLWALVYAGTLTQHSGALDPELAQGQTIYASACSGCHGSNGEGGTGRPLADVVSVFPERADHIAWVENGSPEPGTPYGSPDLPGGQRLAGSNGYTTKMPAFKDTLSPEEIAAVVRYERETFGGEVATPSTGEEVAGGGATTTAVPGSTGDSQAQGESEPGGTNAGSQTNQAETQGGDVGGNNPESQSDNTATDASPAAGGTGNAQTSETGTSGSSTGIGADTGDSTSTTAGE